MKERDKKKNVTATVVNIRVQSPQVRLDSKQSANPEVKTTFINEDTWASTIGTCPHEFSGMSKT